jgi:hypothetical protein
MVFSFSVGQQDAARGVLRHFAHMESDATALWYILHDRQKPLELRRHSHGDVVAKSGNLVADALQRVAEPATVDDKATSDGGAVGLITKQLYVHNFLGVILRQLSSIWTSIFVNSRRAILFFVSVVVVDADEGACKSENLSESDEDGMVDFSERMRYKPTRKQCTPEGAHCSSDDELELFHGSYCVLRF